MDATDMSVLWRRLIHKVSPGEAGYSVFVEERTIRPIHKDVLGGNVGMNCNVSHL